MNKAYIVTREMRIEKKDVEGVFTTRAKAEAFVEKLKAQDGEYWDVSVEIEEHEIDKESL